MSARVCRLRVPHAELSWDQIRNSFSKSVVNGGLKTVQKNRSLIKLAILQTLLVKHKNKEDTKRPWLTTSQCHFLQEKYDHKKFSLHQNKEEKYHTG